MFKFEKDIHHFSGIEETIYSARKEEEALPPEWSSPYFVDESSSQSSTKKKGGFKKVNNVKYFCLMNFLVAGAVIKTTLISCHCLNLISFKIILC